MRRLGKLTLISGHVELGDNWPRLGGHDRNSSARKGGLEFIVASVSSLRRSRLRHLACDHRHGDVKSPLAIVYRSPNCWQRSIANSTLRCIPSIITSTWLPNSIAGGRSSTRPLAKHFDRWRITKSSEPSATLLCSMSPIRGQGDEFFTFQVLQAGNVSADEFGSRSSTLPQLSDHLDSLPVHSQIAVTRARRRANVNRL